MSSAVDRPWPTVIEVIPGDNRCLHVRFADGRRVTLDLALLIERRDAYWRLRQDRYFRRVGIDPLGAICWPEGEDLAPNGLERYVVAEQAV